MRRRAGLTLVVIAALSTTGCLGSRNDGTHAATEPDGAIAGTLWMSGGPAPGHRRLRNTSIRVLAENRTVATTTTDSRGRFRVAPALGRYRFALITGSGLLLPKHVNVATGTTSRIRLTLSVK